MLFPTDCQVFFLLTTLSKYSDKDKNRQDICLALLSMVAVAQAFKYSERM